MHPTSRLRDRHVVDSSLPPPLRCSPAAAPPRRLRADGLRRRAPPAGAHRIRRDRRRSPRVRRADRASRRVDALLARRAHDARHAAAGVDRARPTPLRTAPAATATPEERKAFQQQQVREGLELRAWWLQEMLATPSPLTERMTLFWHNHFVSSQQKVRVARLMYRQNALLRAQRARQLRRRCCTPCRRIRRCWSTSTTRRTARAAPNENFAREVMELFTLGEGQLQRAGHQGSRARLHRLEHRPRHRRVPVPPRAARRRREDGARPQRATSTATTCSTSCSRSRRPPSSSPPSCGASSSRPSPDPREVKRIAARSSARRLRRQGRAARAARRPTRSGRRRIAARSSRARSTSSSARCASSSVAPARRAAVRASSLAGIGQNLFSPPNVKGWPGGEAWINSDTLLARKQFLERARADGRRASGDGDAPRCAPTATRCRRSRGAEARDAPQGVDADDDKVRAQRFAQRDGPRRAQRAVRRRAVGRAPAGRYADREAAIGAARCCCRCRRVTADPPADADAIAFVRATLLDPAYQLK